VAEQTADPRDKSFPFRVWSGLLAPEHRQRIGSAIWTFLWLVRRTTKEKAGIGTVLGGKPVKAREIARDLGIHPESVKRDIDRLRSEGYILTDRTSYGLQVYILRSKRWKKASDKDAVSGHDSP
jgi:biotin operon repressor